MNIAILIPGLGGGGAERVSQILGDYFVDRGDKVYYFLQDINIKQDYPVKGEVIKTGIRSCMSGDAGDAERFMRLLISSLEMRKWKFKYKIDVAISFMEELNYINVLSKGREKVITRVCTILSQRKDMVGFLYKKRIVRLFYSMADQVIVMSNYALKDMCCYYGVSRKKLIIIPNAVKECRKEGDDEWEYGAKAIVCMGRLEAVKQQDRIIRAFSCIVSKEEQARLIILGKGPNLNYLRGLCERYRIDDKVKFVGFTEQTVYYLRHARVYVMASKVEGFPNSMIEAMSCGAPVITTDSPGACGEIIGKNDEIESANSMIPCKYGILVPTMPDTRVNPDQPLAEEEKIMAEAMMKILTDDRIYVEYKKRSLKRAKMYSIDKIGKKWEYILKVK